MILKKLEIQGYGPFSSKTTIDIDEKVTVLTGQNDVGKSSILRLIRLMNGDVEPNEDDQNADHRYDTGSNWKSDNQVFCIATFVITSNFQLYLQATNLTLGDEVDIQCFILQNRKMVIRARRGKASFEINNPNVHRFPAILYLPLENELSSQLNTDNINELEEYFLSLAFGTNGIEKLRGLTENLQLRDVRAAEKRIKQELSNLLPYEIGLDFTFSLSSRDPLGFAIGFQDKHGADTPIHHRGSGIKKIMSLVIALARVSYISGHVLVLFDEPENSLHADAQHKLRGFLETLASHSEIQVIYTTHSPSMINPMCVTGLRLIERANQNERATSIINNQPYKGNFQLIRVSLGMSPADSLLYAPITVVTEGVTEVLGLPYLLERFYEAKINGFEKVKQLLSLVHFIDGEGNSFEYWCRLAKSQGAKPIIFVDGDKIRRVNQNDIKKRHPDVPVIHLEFGIEFEDIVPKETYFAALTETNKIEATYDNFVAWQNKANLPKQIMFSKRVDRWLDDRFPNAIFYKQNVMRKALEIVDLNEIKQDVFLKLVQEIFHLLRYKS